jgi:hypothetical protein
MVGEIIHFGAKIRLTRSLPQISPIDRVYRFNMPMVYALRWRRRAHPGSPRVRHKGIPSGVKDGIGEARFMVCPQKQMQDAGCRLTQANDVRVSLPCHHLHGFDENSSAI